jgi:hypothetical protein
MRGNDDLTIYSKGVNPVTRSETWTRSQVRNVVWEDRRAANRLKSGSLEADSVAVYIPMTIWEVSIKAEDVIVRGLVSDEIGAGFSITTLRAKYPQSAVVRSVDRMGRGSTRMRHWQIGAR